MRFYKIGGQIVVSEGVLRAGTELIPNTSDGRPEQHVPQITGDRIEVKVRVGSDRHPMTPEHHIEWILLETEYGYQMQHLTPGRDPMAEFAAYDNVRAAYAYCSLHGLWASLL